MGMGRSSDGGGSGGGGGVEVEEMRVIWENGGEI